MSLSVSVQMKGSAFQRYSMLGGVAALAALGWASAGCQLTRASMNVATPEPGVEAPVVSTDEKQLLSDVPNAIQYAVNGRVPAGVAQDAAAGPGIVVCSGVVPSSDAQLKAFAEGCAAWLQLIVGGQPQFGRTPSWHAPIRAGAEMNQPGLALSANQAKALASICGATHAAVATLTPSGPDTYLLSYRLVKTSDGSAVGGAITAQGTQDQIARQLPVIAAKLSGLLGLAHAALPNTAVSSGNDLEFLGNCRWDGSLNDSDAQRLNALAHQKGNALAVALDFYGPKLYSVREQRALIDLALSVEPQNAEMITEVGDLYPKALSNGEQSLVAAAAKRYTHNFGINAAQAHALESENVSQQVKVAAALTALRCNTLNPDSWSVAAGAYSNSAQDIRQSRVAGGLTQTQWSQLNHLYDYWLGCSERSVHLDNGYVHMWGRVAKAATFDGQVKEADVAERHALAFGTELNDNYSWGLEMYQPKWEGDPAKLSALTDVAGADARLTPSDLLNITDSDGAYTSDSFSNTLMGPAQDANVKDAYNLLINVAVRRLQPLLKATPNDASLHEQLGNAYNALNQQTDARREYETAARLAPSDPDIQYRFADQLYSMHSYGRALQGYQTVARLEPEYPQIHFDIGYAYKERGDYPGAIEEFTREASITPTSAPAYIGLGDVYSLQKNQAAAVQAWLKAAELDPWQQDAWNNAAGSLDSLQQPGKSVAAAEKGLTYYPYDSVLYVVMEDDYLKLHHPEITLQLCDQDLKFDKDPEETADSNENIAEADLEEHKIGDAQREWQHVIQMGQPDIAAVARTFLAKYPTGKPATAPPS